MQYFLLILEILRLLIEQFKSGHVSISEVREKSRLYEKAKAAKAAGMTDDDLLSLADLVRDKNAEKKPTAKPPSESGKKSGKTKTSSA